VRIILRAKKAGNIMNAIDNTICRIQKMEQYFDEIIEVMNFNPELMHSDEVLQWKLQELIEYYENGQWLKDYECDERGELPTDLKRGVLSEDGVYNLLCDIGQYEKNNMES
jgi:hypothetical protein